MTPEEITAMAEEAGFPFNKYGLLQGDDDGEIDADAAFASFAALVAAKEREACAQVCEANRTNPPQGKPDDVERGFNAAIRRCAAAIRTRDLFEGAPA